MPEYTLEIVVICTAVFLIACAFYTFYLFLSKTFGHKSPVADLNLHSIEHLQDRVRELESCLTKMSMLLLKSDDRFLLEGNAPNPRRRIVKSALNPEVKKIKKRMGRPPKNKPIEAMEK